VPKLTYANDAILDAGSLCLAPSARMLNALGVFKNGVIYSTSLVVGHVEKHLVASFKTNYQCLRK